MSGATIGGAIGAAIGFYFGGPAGARWGWMIGSAVGGYVDPEQIEGPRLKDVRGQTSAVGGSIPHGWATFPAPCNVIWQQPGVSEHKHTESGKGGGPEQVTYIYTRSYALMFHIGEITGLLQIKRNGKIVLDARDESLLAAEYMASGMTEAQAWRKITGQRSENAKWLSKCTIYTGSQTQNPDPTIEAYEGVGNVPSYRGRAYMVVTDDDVTDLQGAIPQLEVIVNGSGVISTDSINLGEYWNPSDRTNDETGGMVLSNGSQDAKATSSVDPSNAFGVRGSQGRSSGRYYVEFECLRVESSKSGFVGLATSAFNLADNDGDGGFNETTTLGHDFLSRVSVGLTNSPVSTTPVSGDRIGVAVDLDTKRCWIHINGSYAGGTDPSVASGLFGATIPSGTLFPVFTADDSGGVSGSDGSSVRIHVLSESMLYFPSGSFAPFSNWGPAVQPMPDVPGWYMLPDGTLISFTPTTGQTTVPVTIGEIIAELCESEGLSSDEYDVTQLTDLVTGFVIARETDAASVIDSLRPIGMFDPGEWDAKVRFIKRGGNVVAAINGDDLVERDGDPFEREMVQEVELLRRVTVGYIDPAAAYAENTQKWERRVGTVLARGEASIEVAAVMSADQAATIAKRKGLAAWGEPEKQKFSLPYRLAALTPTDVIDYTHADGEVYSVRLMQTEDDSGVRHIESADNCVEAYNATATGVAPKPPIITDTRLIGPTNLVVMDLPLWRTSDSDDLGLYLAAGGYFSGWTGAQVDVSIDGGATYIQSIQITESANIGHTTTDLSAWASSENSVPQSVTVYLPVAPSSVSYDTLLQYANRAALELDDGSWEILQYQTVTALGSNLYELSGLIRGRFNTTPGVATAQATFVLLDNAVTFARAERHNLGQTITVRATGYGTSSDASIPFDYAFSDGASQTEWPVHNVTASRDGSNNVTVSWVGRARLGAETSPYHSTHFTGYRVSYSDGQTYDVGPTVTTHTRTSAPASQTIAVAPINDITGAGPASAGITV